MEFLSTIWNIILDALFGKSDIEEKIRLLTEEQFLVLMRPIERNEGVVSLFRFENNLIREMVFALKYRKNVQVAKLFAAALSSYLVSSSLTEALIIPIPLSRKRRSERGYNQVELVLSYLDSKKVNLDVLSKMKETAPQTSLHRSERLKNLNDAFAVTHTSIVNGKNIILVDDVTTSGSTLKEAARILKNAGVKSVHCVALAR